MSEYGYVWTILKEREEGLPNSRLPEEQEFRGACLELHERLTIVEVLMGNEDVRQLSTRIGLVQDALGMPAVEIDDSKPGSSPAIRSLSKRMESLESVGPDDPRARLIDLQARVDEFVAWVERELSYDDYQTAVRGKLRELGLVEK